ncbi:hypothetical protein V1264_008656 [Littorina saxatilis]|uniref:Uncharacterized protein n=1 Tax=Littorina saxatilis TaxID=31220 RepID=A0AAN9AU34_9CAEN
MYGPRRERTPDMYGHICSARSVFLLYLPPLKRTPAKRGRGHSFSVPTAGHTSNVRTDHRQIFTTTKSITEQSGSWYKDHSRNGVTTVTGNLSAPVPIRRGGSFGQEWSTCEDANMKLHCALYSCLLDVNNRNHSR